MCDAVATFTTVQPLTRKVNAIYPPRTVCFEDGYREALDALTLCELSNENEWLEHWLTNPTPWTNHYGPKARDNSENIFTINVLLPSINYKPSTAELQYHLMKTAVEYTQYLNP